MTLLMPVTPRWPQSVTAEVRPVIDFFLLLLASLRRIWPIYHCDVTREENSRQPTPKVRIKINDTEVASPASLATPWKQAERSHMEVRIIPHFCKLKLHQNSGYLSILSASDRRNLHLTLACHAHETDHCFKNMDNLSKTAINRS